MIGSMRVILSISSPKNSMRTASSSYAGQSSSTSPRTRNVPRARSYGVRSYCISVSLRRYCVIGLSMPRSKKSEHRVIEIGIADAVDAGHRGDDDDVAALEEGLRRGEPQLVDLVVLGHLLFDVQIVLRDVRLGLVVVVVRDEVLDRVLGKEVLELLVELRRQGLVVAEDERRPVDVLDDLGDGEGLAGAGDAEEDLVARAGLDAFRELADGLGLIALRREGEMSLKFMR